MSEAFIWLMGAAFTYGLLAEDAPKQTGWEWLGILVFVIFLWPIWLGKEIGRRWK